MKPKITLHLSDVQKTLLLPVWARAKETAKKKPLLTDTVAERIISSVDFDFRHLDKNIKVISQIAWIARCKRFDLIIKDFLKDNPKGTIVNIGCGLDTTYERINNNSVKWFDLDLPEVIDLRKRFLKETENRKFIASSFTDTVWFNKIPSDNRILFISTGVFVYFEEQVIKDFIIQIADRFIYSELFFDVTSPKGVQIANKIIKDSSLNSSSFFRWGLKNISVITAWDQRIKLLNTYYTFKIKGLGMGIKNKVTGFLSDSAGVQYMVHLKITKN